MTEDSTITGSGTPPQDNAEQETTDSQSSTGTAISEVINEMMEAEGWEDSLSSFTPTMQEECLNEFLKCLNSGYSDGTSTGTGTDQPQSENQQDILAIKSEPQLDVASPDSGYQPPSNASCISISDEGGLPVSTSRFSSAQRPTLYEIEPQPFVISPARNNHPGKYTFRLTFKQNDSAAIPKNISHTHSKVLNKLFVKPDSPCPVWFQCSESPPEGSLIRGMLVFLKQENVHEAVCRCQIHKLKQEERYLAPHVLQTVEHQRYSNQFYPSYDTSKGRFSVLCSYGGANPTSNGDECMKQYKFMCLSTCVGGINRRPMLAVFTLEDPMGGVLGRASIEVKVCSSPGRDRTREEQKKMASIPGGSRIAIPLPRKRSAGSGDSSVGYKFLRVKDKHFEILSSINDALNMSDMVPDELRKQYVEGEQKYALADLVKMLNKDDMK